MDHHLVFSLTVITGTVTSEAGSLVQAENFLFATISRQVLSPVQPPIQ
jgi:hypothetical protein